MIERAINAALRPLRRAIENMVDRAFVTAVTSGKLQVLQVKLSDGDPKDGVLHFEPAGLTSHPLADAEAVVLFPDGVRSKGIAVVVTDRRHRPTDLQPGEAALFCHADGLAQVRVELDGTVTIKGPTKVRVEGHDIEFHAAHSWSWDVDGYGQRLTSLGGGTYQLHTWQQDAVFQPQIIDPINPPEGP